MLRSLMETDRKNTDSLMKELEAVRIEMNTRGDKLELTRVEAAARDEELKMLRHSHHLHEQLKEAFRKEENEKIQLAARLEQVSEALASSRELIGKQQHGLSSVETEYQRSLKDLQDVRVKASTVEEIGRENERLKVKLDNSKQELKEMALRLSNQARDLSEMQSETKDLEARLMESKEEAAQLRASKNVLEKVKVEITTAYQEERGRANAAEAALQELRSGTEALRKDFVEERQSRQAAERLASDGSQAVKEVKDEAGRACSMSFEAIQRWDRVLSNVLDGNFFDSIGQNGKYGAPILHIFLNPLNTSLTAFNQ